MYMAAAMAVLLSTAWRVASRRRCGVHSKPPTIITSAKTTVCLLIIPMPATAPIASHQRESRVRNSRTIKNTRTAQKTWSVDVVPNKKCGPRIAGSSAPPSAASSWTRRPPPNSRRDERRHQNCEAGCQTREHAKCHCRRAQHVGLPLGEQRRQRRVIDEAPCHVPPAGEVIELVAMDTVATRQRQQHGTRDGRNGNDRHRGKPIEPSRGPIGGWVGSQRRGHRGPNPSSSRSITMVGMAVSSSR